MGRRRFAPGVAVLLNLTPDHLDRYPTSTTTAPPRRACSRTRSAGDCRGAQPRRPVGVGAARATRAPRCISFGREPVEFGTFVDGDDVGGLGRRASRSATRSPRARCAARTTARTCWRRSPRRRPGACRRDAIQRASPDDGLPHRLELVRERDGVRFFDDSKGTNVGAVEKSLASFAGGIVLLLGGYDKGGDFARCAPLLARARARTSCASARPARTIADAARRRGRGERWSPIWPPRCTRPPRWRARAGTCAAVARLRQLRRVPRLSRARRALPRAGGGAVNRLRPLSRLQERVIMPRLTRPDVWLLGAVAGLVGFGIVMVFNASYFFAARALRRSVSLLPQARHRRVRRGGADAGWCRACASSLFERWAAPHAAAVPRARCCWC